jgi:hypothetical protein
MYICDVHALSPRALHRIVMNIDLLTPYLVLGLFFGLLLLVLFALG